MFVSLPLSLFALAFRTMSMRPLIVARNRYASLLPIHALWRPYAQALLGLVDVKGKPVPSVLSPVLEPAVADESEGQREKQWRWHVHPLAMSTMQMSLVKAELAGCWITGASSVPLLSTPDSGTLTLGTPDLSRSNSQSRDQRTPHSSAFRASWRVKQKAPSSLLLLHAGLKRRVARERREMEVEHAVRLCLASGR